MTRITLTLLALLLALPVAAHAKAGVEFDSAIETSKPGARQAFSAMVMNEPADPTGGEPEPITGVRPLVTFTNESTGKVMRVRASRTNRDGIGRGSVTFPDHGPWTASLTVAGKPFETGGQSFEISGPPADPALAPPSDGEGGGGGLPAWLLSFPAAGLVALGIWRLRRRPR